MPRATVLACTILTACAPKVAEITPIEAADATAAPTWVDEVSLELDFRGVDGQGFARLVQHPDHLEISVIVEGATPGAHDLCVHEYGDCSDPDYMRAGVHYAPLDTDPDDTGYHVGDLGVVQVASDGRGELVVRKYDLGLEEVLWRSVVMHAEADDGHGHGAHGAGYRVACGPIQPGGASQLAEVKRELMDLRHYVQRLGTYMATAPSP